MPWRQFEDSHDEYKLLFHSVPAEFTHIRIAYLPGPLEVQEAPACVRNQKVGGTHDETEDFPTTPAMKASKITEIPVLINIRSNVRVQWIRNLRGTT